MKKTYALDTNTISYFLRGEGKIDVRFYREIVEGNNSYAIPFVVAYEIKRWLNDNPTKQKQVFARAFEHFFRYVEAKAALTADIWDEAVDIYIRLKQKGQLIGDADILIAAYCIVNDYTLVTRNERDFERIENLKIVNWHN